MVTFNTKKEAEAFAIKRRKGFRAIIKKDPSRNLTTAINSTKKIRKIKNKGWKSPLYEYQGM